MCGHELVGELDTGLIEVTVKVRQPKSPQTVRIKDVEVWLNRHGQDTGRDRSQVPPPAYARHEDDPKYACTLCALFQTVVHLTVAELSYQYLLAAGAAVQSCLKPFQ